MRDSITIECQKLNGKLFNGTVNFSEVKIKMFEDGLGLDAGLLETVKINFNKCPVVTFKLKSKINVPLSIKNQQFDFTRIYHSKGILKTDSINCKVMGITIQARRSFDNQASNNPGPDDVQKETIIKIDVCDSLENACKLKSCLAYYGEVLTEIIHFMSFWYCGDC